MNAFEPVVEPVVETKSTKGGVVGKALLVFALLAVGFLAGFQIQSVQTVAPPMMKFDGGPGAKGSACSYSTQCQNYCNTSTRKCT